MRYTCDYRRDHRHGAAAAAGEHEKSFYCR